MSCLCVFSDDTPCQTILQHQRLVVWMVLEIQLQLACHPAASFATAAWVVASPRFRCFVRIRLAGLAEAVSRRLQPWDRCNALFSFIFKTIIFQWIEIMNLPKSCLCVSGDAASRGPPPDLGVSRRYQEKPPAWAVAGSHTLPEGPPRSWRL